MISPDDRSRVSPDLCTPIHRQAEEIVASAYCRLERHFMFKGYLKSLEISYQSGNLTMTGQLPSFYLKQVLQTALRDLPGVDRVNNRVAVVSSNSLSSAPSESDD